MPCDYTKYPINWFSEIRPAILQRADNCCEVCHVPNYSILCNPDRILIRSNKDYAEAKEAMKHCHPSDRAQGFIIVVLTISHLDHFPMNCDPANLRALCQKCHNSWDAPHRAKTRHRNRLAALEKTSPSLPLVTSIISKI